MTSLFHLRQIIIICVLVFLVGILITDLSHKYVQKQEKHALNEHFDGYAFKAYSALQRGIKAKQNRLKSFAMVFEASEHVSSEEFDRYALLMMNLGKPVQSLQWVSIIQKVDRATFEQRIQAEGFKDFKIKSALQKHLAVAKPAKEYAVITYVYPFESNKEALGLDFYSSDQQRNYLLNETKLGKQIASYPIQLVQAPNDPPAVVLSQPIYDAKARLRGYVNLVLNIDDFWTSAIQEAGLEKNLQYKLYDQKIESKPYLAFDEVLIDRGGENFRFQEFLMSVGERNWRFVVKADLTKLSEYERYGKKGHLTLLILGWGFSAIFTGLLFLWLRFRNEKLITLQSLKAQELRYEELFEQSSDAFYVLDYEGNILNVNSETVSLVGYSKAQLLTMNFSEIDQTCIQEKSCKICNWIDLKDKVFFESHHKCQNGRMLPVEVSVTKCLLSSGGVISVFVRDLTMRLSYRELQKVVDQSTEALEEQKKAFQTVFDKSADGIFICEGRRVLNCNEATVKMFGYPSKQVLLKLPNSVFAPKFQPDGETSFRKGNRMLNICRIKGYHRYEWLNKRANGEEFWTDVVLTSIEYYSRPVVHIAFRDISKRKKLEAEAIAAKEIAIQSSLAKSKFLANISHEIRTPLHGILGYAQMGATRLENLSQKKLKRYFETIDVSGQRLLLLLNDVLDSAKLESGFMRFNFQVQSLNEVIQLCIQEQASLAADKNSKIIFSGLPITAYFDSIRLSQVLRNLISNAIRFTPEGGVILIRTKLLGGDIQVSILDDGHGFDEDEMFGIFENFIQGRKNDASAVGTGLGLSISRDIIRAHHGKIWVENRVKDEYIVGAMVLFTLPIHKEAWLKTTTKS